jgi:hypothetical protein
LSNGALVLMERGGIERARLFIRSADLRNVMVRAEAIDRPDVWLLEGGGPAIVRAKGLGIHCRSMSFDPADSGTFLSSIKADCATRRCAV